MHFRSLHGAVLECTNLLPFGWKWKPQDTLQEHCQRGTGADRSQSKVTPTSLCKCTEHREVSGPHHQLFHSLNPLSLDCITCSGRPSYCASGLLSPVRWDLTAPEVHWASRALLPLGFCAFYCPKFSRLACHLCLFDYSMQQLTLPRYHLASPHWNFFS